MALTRSAGYDIQRHYTGRTTQRMGDGHPFLRTAGDTSGETDEQPTGERSSVTPRLEQDEIVRQVMQDLREHGGGARQADAEMEDIQVEPERGAQPQLSQPEWRGRNLACEFDNVQTKRENARSKWGTWWLNYLLAEED